MALVLIQHSQGQGLTCTPSSSSIDHVKDPIERRREIRRVRQLQSKNPDERSPLLVHIPSCRDTQQTGEIASAMERIGFTCGWPLLVPSRINGHEGIYLAAHGMAEAFRCAQRGEPPDVARRMCSHSYAKAVSHLRASIQSPEPNARDASLLMSALLHFLDWCLEPAGGPSLYAHMRGIPALLLSAPRDKPLSDVECSVLYFNWMGMFHLPVACGTPSPFDEPLWLDAEIPLAAYNCRLSFERRLLAKSGKDLFIRLPRLIALIRCIRSDPENRLAANEAMTLAGSLMTMKNDNAETELLHEVNIRKTSDRMDAFIVPHSFIFEHETAFRHAVCYWQVRILTHRLCIRLHDLGHPVLGAGDREELLSQNMRLAQNILMSWEYAWSLGRSVGRWALRIGFIAAWAVTLDVPHMSKNVSSERVRWWILRRYSDIHHTFNVATEEQMDEAAELLVGGPRRGFLLDIVRMPDGRSVVPDPT